MIAHRVANTLLRSLSTEHTYSNIHFGLLLLYILKGEHYYTLPNCCLLWSTVLKIALQSKQLVFRIYKFEYINSPLSLWAPPSWIGGELYNLKFEYCTLSLYLVRVCCSYMFIIMYCKCLNNHKMYFM